MLDILGVEPGSIAEELAIAAGDRLLSINGQPVRDLIDYLVAVDAEEIVLEIERSDGEIWDLELEFDRDDNLGLILPHPEPTECGNNCIFCFVHQLPKGLRRSLYVKDEDYRFSYLYGAYVTLTNLDEASLTRIVEQHLSPLYVSVHATDEDLRKHLLGKDSPPILDLLRTLVKHDIEIHAQIVICPGVNDGAQLDKTYADLLGLAPGVRSLAIVPVGLTGYRQKLPDLQPVSAQGARQILDWIDKRQAECLAAFGSRFVFAADELYLLAGHEFPELPEYEALAQIENGVGMIPMFRHQAREVLEQSAPLHLPPVSIITGLSAAREIERFAGDLASKTGLDLRVHILENRFFGGHVTVTGLLAGSDILNQLPRDELGELLLLPDVMLREGDDVLLDDMRVSELEQQLGVRIVIADADPWGLWTALESLAFEQPVDRKNRIVEDKSYGR